MKPLKLKRILSGKRQIDVFNETNIWPGRLSMIENDLIKPRKEELGLLAKAYGTTPEELLNNGKHSDDCQDER